MSIGPGQSLSAALRWAQEWQRLRLTATNKAMGQYLHGCAKLAMARTPQHALVALHETQSDLLRHSAGTIAGATRLWRKQNTELIVMRDARVPTSKQAPNCERSDLSKREQR
jgi:hypothetical protein